jgi:hypothetical protein
MTDDMNTVHDEAIGHEGKKCSVYDFRFDYINCTNSVVME